MPSFEEVWGLVVNEALASGIYVLSSQYAGASYDLIKDGFNGEVFNPNNVEEIIRVIKKTKRQINDIRKRREIISQDCCKEFNIKQYLIFLLLFMKVEIFIKRELFGQKRFTRELEI